MPYERNGGVQFTLRLADTDVAEAVDQLADDRRWSKASTVIYCFERGVEIVGTHFPDGFEIERQLNLPQSSAVTEPQTAEKISVYTDRTDLIDTVEAVAESHAKGHEFSTAARYYLRQGLNAERAFLAECPYCFQTGFSDGDERINHIASCEP